MKTTTNNIKFPGTAKFFAFVVLISGLAFLSCMVASAQASSKATTTTYLDEIDGGYADVLKANAEFSRINMDQVWAARLERALVPETEERLEVESWMLNTGSAAEAFEESVELEDWMLDRDYFFSTECYEEALVVEDWMINYDNSNDIYEEALELEPWMLDTDYYTVGTVNEDPIALEDWMLN